MKETRMTHNRKTSVTVKIVLLTVSVGLISLIASDWYIYSVARKVIRNTAISELTAIRETKARQIEDHFDHLRQLVGTLAESDRLLRAVREFRLVYKDLDEKFLPDPMGMIMVDAALSDHQREQLIATGMSPDSDPRRFAPPLPASAASRVLQYLYMLGRKEQEMAAAADDYSRALLAAFDAVHRSFEPLMKTIVQGLGFFDLFLVDPQTGVVVYSYAKEPDFATSLESGPYRNTELAAVYKAARDTDSPAFVRISDFKLYGPSGFAPAAFIGCPIFLGAKKEGILILQVSIDEINAIMTADRRWAMEGMGRTGESLLIGPDLRMRSDSRFLLESPESYFATMEARGTDSGTLGLMERNRTAILLQSVDTVAGKELIEGKTGVRLTEDYRGKLTLNAFRPVQIPDLEWGILVKVDESELMEPVFQIRRKILLVIPFLLAAIVGISVLLSRQILRPVGLLLDGIRSLQKGDLGARVSVVSSDEIGTLAKAFNKMADNLQEAHDQRRLVLDSAGEGIFGLDTTGVVTFVNAAALGMLGYTEAQVMQQPMHPLVHHSHPDGTPFPKETCSMYLSYSQGEVHTVDSEVLWRKDGTPIPVEYNSMPIRKGGEVIGAVVSFRDIAERKAAEEAIRRSEERVRRILDTASEGFWFLDNDAVTLQVNPAMCRILGREEGEVVGRKGTEFYDEKGREILREQLALRDQGVDSSYENEVVRPDGTRVSCLFSATPFFDENGVKVGAFAMVTDITEKRRAEEAMRESEQRLKLALKGGNIGFWDIDFVSEASVYDEKWAQMLGYELKEIEQTRQTWVESVHPEDRERVLQVGQDYREGKRSEYEVEYRAVTKTGNERWFVSRGTAVSWDEAGKPVRMVGTVRDITDRKRAEMVQARRLRSEKAMAAVSRALLGSSTEQETLRGALKQLLTAAQVDRVYVFRNREDQDRGLCMEHWLEADAPGIEPIGSDDRPVVWPYQKGFSRWVTEMAGGRPVMGTVAELPEAERERLKHRELVSLLNLPIFVQGKWFGFVGFEDAFLERFWSSSDVTLLGTTAEIIGAFVERQQVQEEIRASEERVKTIVHSISAGIIVIHPEDRTISDVNPVAAEMIGLPREKIVGKICHRFICPREDRNCPILDLEEEIDNAERVLLTADGREIPILKTVVPVMLGGKKHLLESFVDISERKAAEEELQRNLEELERFNQLTINREERMIRLKEEINELQRQMGMPEKYKIVE